MNPKDPVDLAASKEEHQEHQEAVAAMLHEFHYNALTGFIHCDGQRIRPSDVSYYRPYERSGKKRGEKIFGVELLVAGKEKRLEGVSLHAFDQLLQQALEFHGGRR